MKTFADAIEAAEKVNTKKEKFAALSGIVPQEQRLIVEAMNPYRVFNVKKWVDQPGRHAKSDTNIKSFYALLDNLHSRKLTGDAARAAVQDTLSWYTKRTAKYLARVLKKDLDCGAQRKTFKKIYPNLNIPEFKVMLAEKMTKEYKWEFPCLAEAKYDGQRVIAFVDPEKETVTYFSRSGKPADFCNGLFDKELLELVSNEADGEPVVVDGEVMGKSFQESMTAKGRKNDKAKKNLRLYAFDWMPQVCWEKQRYNQLQVDRSIGLRELIEDSDFKTIMPAQYKIVKSVSEAKQFYNEMLKEGYEGLIIKDLEAEYTWKRSSAWTKWKPVITLDLTIVELVKGKGKYSNSCGAVKLEGEDENGLKIKTRMGTGMSDAVRDMLWRKRNTMVNKTMEVEAQELVRGKNKETYALRWAVFKKIRDDK